MGMEQVLLIGLLAAIAGFLLSVGISFRLFRALRRSRREASESYEIALRLQEDWEKNHTRLREERRKLQERFDEFQSGTEERVDRFENVAAGTRERLVRLEQYLKEFFEVELKAVFESFDKTVASVLDEMKTELLRGVDRIEEIQAVVDSKSYAQDRILDGEGSVYRLISNKKEEPDVSAAPAAEDEPAVESAQAEPEAPDQNIRSDPPNLRLKADEGE